jgi:hypothetical protein
VNTVGPAMRRRRRDRAWGKASLGHEAGGDPPVTPATAGASRGSGGRGARIRGHGHQAGGGRGGHTGPELAGAGEFLWARTIDEQAGVAEAYEAGGNDVPQEAAQEFCGLQFHALRRALGRIVFVAKAHDTVADKDQARIGKRDPMSGAAEIGEPLRGTAPGRFGRDDPRCGVEVLTERRPGRVLG